MGSIISGQVIILLGFMIGIIPKESQFTFTGAGLALMLIGLGVGVLAQDGEERNIRYYLLGFIFFELLILLVIGLGSLNL